MARKITGGLGYFPHDVGLLSDRKLRPLRRKYGYMAQMLYLVLLEMIYGDKGYYLDYSNKEDTILDILDYFAGGDGDPGEEAISDAIDDLVKYGLLSEPHYRDGILTSHRIQETYYQATADRKIVTVDPSIWMLTHEEMEELALRHSLLKDVNQTITASDRSITASDGSIKDDNGSITASETDFAASEMRFAGDEGTITTDDQTITASDRSIVGGNRPSGTQSKVKESKVKESKGKESKAAAVAAASKKSKASGPGEAGLDAAAAADLAELHLNDAFDDIIDLLRVNICPITPVIRSQVYDWIMTCAPECIIYAIQEATLNGARSVKYVDAILERMRRDGIRTADDIARVRMEKIEKQLPF